MRQFLVHAKTFARIEEALKPFSDQISPLVLDDEGDLKHPWGESEAESAIAFGTVDAYFSSSVRVFLKTIMEFERLEWFQSSAAGTEHPMLQAIGQKAELYSGSHEQAEAIAEWVLWAGLDYFQAGAARRQAQADASWTRLPFREISSTRWLIVGFGAIGVATGRRLRALGADVTGVRRSGGTSEAANRIITPDQLVAALPDVDAVLMSVPLTPETENLANADFFSAMKPDSLFVNVGRGGLVDEEALLNALSGGRPAHASLDVVREEPLSDSSPIWSHPKVTLTPHISALTDQSKLRTDQVFVRNLGRFLRQESLENAVDPKEFS